MIAAVELEDDEALIPPIATWSHRPRDGDWTAGYDELVRAAGAFARGVSFLTRHWDELEPETLGGLLRSIEATAHDVNRMLGHTPVRDSSLDETLAARMFAKFGDAPFYIGRVEDTPSVYEVPSPELAG